MAARNAQRFSLRRSRSVTELTVHTIAILDRGPSGASVLASVILDRNQGTGKLQFQPRKEDRHVEIYHRSANVIRSNVEVLASVRSGLTGVSVTSCVTVVHGLELVQCRRSQAVGHGSVLLQCQEKSLGVNTFCLNNSGQV